MDLNNFSSPQFLFKHLSESVGVWSVANDGFGEEGIV